jgi:RND family efflux transporter MFP subunit
MWPPSSRPRPAKRSHERGSRQEPCLPGLFALTQYTSSGMKKIIFILFFLAFVAGGLGFYLFNNRSVAQVYIAQRGKAIAAVYGTVRMDSVFSQKIKTRNYGYISFAEGIFSNQSSLGFQIKKGQLLATINDETINRQLNQAKVELASAVDKQKLGPPSDTALKASEEELAKMKKLLEQNNIARVEFDRKQAEVVTLHDRVSSEKIDLDRLVELARQNQRGLEERISANAIRSPMDGIITEIPVSDGEIVNENQPIFTVATKSTFVTGLVNEEDVGQIQPGMKASLRLYSFQDHNFTAKVTNVSPNADGNQRYTVFLDIVDPAPNIMAGMTGEMNIIIGSKENALLVPTRALMTDRVFIVKDEVVKMRPVTIGYRSLERVEIKDGINEGDLVIVADQDLFRPGQRVRVVEENNIKSGGR